MHSNTRITALLCLTLSGCGGYFPPNRNVKRKIATSEVVGTWKLMSQSLALLKRDGFVVDPGHAYTITFNTDGTLKFASVIDGFHSRGATL